MLIYPDHLKKHLKQNFSNKLLIYGGEVQQTKDCSTLYRDVCTSQGYTELKKIEIEDVLNWQQSLDFQNLDMFSNKKLLELNLSEYKPFNAKFIEILYQFTSNLPEGYALLIISDNLTPAIKKTAWFTLLEKDYLIVYAGNANKNQIKRYLIANLTEHGFNIEPSALEFLANSCFNNFLLAKQIIEKLLILYSPKTISLSDLQDIDDGALFSVYNLIDLINVDEATEALRCFENLKTQGIETGLILFMLVQETKALLAIKTNTCDNAAIFKKYNIWKNKQALLLNKAQHISIIELKIILEQCQVIDFIQKGYQSGNIWLQLQQVVLSLLGSYYASTI